MGKIKRRKLCIFCNKEYSASNISRHYKNIHSYYSVQQRENHFERRIVSEILKIVKQLNLKQLSEEDFNSFFDYATVILGFEEEIRSKVKQWILN
jgi:hypothetical protein